MPFNGLRVGLIAGLSESKLSQIVAPLEKLPEVTEILLFRRKEFTGTKVRWARMPDWTSGKVIIGELVRLGLILKEAKHCDVIVGIHQRFHGVWAWLAGKIFDKPVIQLVITDVDWINSRCLTRRAMMAGSACGVMGPVSHKKLEKSYFSGAIEIIHLPIDFPKLGNNDHKKIYELLAVGNLTEAKNYPWMLEILAQLKERFPGFKMAICGAGDFEERLGRRINDSGLKGNIEFLGHLDWNELKKVYQNSKVLLLSSRREGLPMAVVEAMSFGLPVVTTAVGDLPWLVRNGKDGKLIQPENTAEFVSAVIELLENPEDLEKMGNQARKRIDELHTQFTIDSIASAWSRLFAAAIKPITNKGSDQN